MAEIKITDDNPEVLKFKKERSQKREDLKKRIQKNMLAKGCSQEDVKNFFETIYDPNGLIKKKHLSPLHTSLLLEDQQKAFETECKNIENEANRYIKEIEDQEKVIKMIAQLRKLQIFDENSIDNVEKILNSQGPSKSVAEKINNMIATSRYVDSLVKLIMRKEPSLKKYMTNIKTFILSNESQFKKKYKNSLAFNNANLNELKNANNVRELIVALPSLLK